MCSSLNGGSKVGEGGKGKGEGKKLGVESGSAVWIESGSGLGEEVGW